MPTIYCNASLCGFPIKYSIAKPAECPRCGASLRPTVMQVQSVEIPLKVSAKIIPPPYKKLSRARIMDDNPPEIAEETQEEDDMGAEESDVYDKAASKRLARQLAANLRASNGIRIEGGYGNERVRLGDWVKETKEQE